MRPVFFVKYIYIFLQLTNLFGVFVIENFPIYLSELRMESADHNSFLLIAIIQFLFFYVLFVFDSYKEKEITTCFDLQNDEINITSVLINFAILISSLLFLNVVNKPAFSLGIDRFSYTSTYLSGKWKYLTQVQSYLLPLMAISIVLGYKRKGIIFVVIYASFLFLTGHKFGGFIEILAILLPAFYEQIKKRASRWLKILSILIVALTGVVFVHNYVTYNGRVDNRKYFIERLAQQGQLWWAMYDLPQNKTTHLDELQDEYQIYFGMNKDIRDKYNYGIYKIMRLTTPSDIVETKIQSGSRYSCSTYATIFYYFKYPGLIIFVPVLAILFGVIANWFYSSVAAGKMIESIISCIFFLDMHKVMSQSDFHVLFSKRNIIYILAYILFVLFRYSSGRIEFKNTVKKRVPKFL